MGIGGLLVGLRLAHLPADSNVSDIFYFIQFVKESAMFSVLSIAGVE